MSINAISSQPSIFSPTTQAQPSQAAVFSLEPDSASIEPPKAAAAKFLATTPITNDEIQARLALLMEQRPEMEARTKAAEEQREAWVNQVKAGIAANNDQPYGQVMKNGQVVATIYNSGSMSGSGIGMIDWDQPAGMKGPELARWRAGQIAEAFGGTVVSQDTAQSQDAWDAAQANREPILGFTEWRVANGFADAMDTRPYYRDPQA